MRIKFLLISTLLLLSVILAACAGQTTQATQVAGTVIPQITEMVPTVVAGVQTEVVPTVVEGAQGIGMDDITSLVATLGAAGMTIEQGGTVEQPFFTAPGQVIKVNGEDLQVFTYETAEALEAEAAQVSVDASTIGTNMPTWVDAPHLFKTGRMLVVYVGQNQKILDVLEAALGSQFAGR